MELIEKYLDQAGIKRKYAGYKYLACAIENYKNGMMFGGENGLYGIVEDALGLKHGVVRHSMKLALRNAKNVEDDEIKPKKFIKTASDILFEQGEDNAKSTM